MSTTSESRVSTELSRSDVHTFADAVPSVGDDQPIINEKTALAAFFDLTKSGSAIPNHIAQQITYVMGSVIPKLESIPGKPDVYVITNDELRGALAAAALQASGQTVLDIGSSLHTSKELEQWLELLFKAPDGQPLSEQPPAA